MNDDYLWDGSGEPDPDIEHLENLLGRYKGAATAPEMPQGIVPRPRRTLLPVAIAATIATVGLGTALLVQIGGYAPIQSASNAESFSPFTLFTPDEPGDHPTPPAPPVISAGKDSYNNKKPALRRDRIGDAPAPAVAPTPENFSNRRSSDSITGFATAMHAERIEVLFRSFRNAPVGGDTTGRDLAYDRKQSRELLTDNALLRQAADRNGDIQAKALLDSVEPLLIDIATLGDNATPDDVRAIQDRIQRKEIVSDLQLYAKASPARGL